MNTNSQKALKEKILNTVFRYDEGEMTRKEWLEYHKQNGATLTNNEMHLKDKTYYELNKTEAEYFKSLREPELIPEFWSVNIMGEMIEADTEEELKKDIINYCRNTFTDNPETDEELLEDIYEEFTIKKHEQFYY